VVSFLAGPDVAWVNARVLRPTAASRDTATLLKKSLEAVIARACAETPRIVLNDERRVGIG
jgi:hypothetical protein